MLNVILILIVMAVITLLVIAAMQPCSLPISVYPEPALFPLPPQPYFPASIICKTGMRGRRGQNLIQIPKVHLKAHQKALVPK